MTAVARHFRGTMRGPILAVVAVVVAGTIAAIVVLMQPSGPRRDTGPAPAHHSTTGATGTTTSSAPTTRTTTTSTLPAPAAGFQAGHVTAVGDSVMLDYQDPLETDIPGVAVDAAVSRQWADGEAVLQQLKTEGQLGAEVIVALGTNGPIADTDFDTMMGILHGASRVVFVTVHVDRPWQGPNNAVLARGAARFPNVVIADWATLADHNPQWFGSDGTHLAIDGPGADALASLIASTLSKG
jgi:hypothetical protein